MVGADAALLQDLEARAARRLDQATLGAVMIPAFGHSGEHASALLLDMPLVLRLVRGFLKEGGGAVAARVAKLVDAYLAEAALEAGLRPVEFEELARAVPAHAHPADDAMYRAVDTYLKVRPRSALRTPSLSHRSWFLVPRPGSHSMTRGTPCARACPPIPARRKGHAHEQRTPRQG
uniref:NPH3 domain-containing protein n=1 Tax=Zea mays TaxID=4577 RepID=A0A804N1X7_MAIZE